MASKNVLIPGIDNPGVYIEVNSQNYFTWLGEASCCLGEDTQLEFVSSRENWTEDVVNEQGEVIVQQKIFPNLIA